MTMIHIFLGSSLEELRLDREALGNYVRKLNDIYMDRGVYIKLYECEYENAAMVDGRKQEEYNEEIRHSDIFLVLLYNKAGKYTVEEFQTAYKQFQAAGAPAILTCFRQGEGYAPEQSVLDFMNALDEQLGHYFKKYTHIDSVKLLLLLQMKLMNLDVPVEVDNSMVTVDGKPVLTLENIPMWAENSDFQKLRTEYTACEQAYLDAKAETADPLTDSAFLRASEQWQDAKKALRELEQELFAIALKIEEKNNDGTLTARQRKAYELMEQGDAEGADRILDLREILDDIAHKENLAQQADEGLEQNVQEMLQKIAIKKTQVKDPNRFDEIRQIYEEAVALEERRHLKKIAMREYISYLHDQHDYKTAIPLAKRYQQYMTLHGSEEERAVAAGLLGNLYYRTNRLDLAKKELQRGEDILEQLVKEKPAAYQPDLATSCNSLGNLYCRTNRMDLAEQEYQRAKNIREQLAKENPTAYQSDLAMSCNNLGNLYADTKRMDLAEQEYQRAKDIYGRLVKENPAAYLSHLAGICNNLGNLYSRTNRMELAEREYLRAKEIQEKLAQENPAAYQPDLAMSCYNLGILYWRTNRMDLEEQEYQRAKNIREQLAEENPAAYQPDLAASCNSLGNLYCRTNRMDLAEQEYLRAKDIYKQLAKENPAAYQPDLAASCNNLGNLYADTKRMDLAEQEYQRAKDIREQLAKENPAAYQPDLAMSCNNLGFLYYRTNRMDLAKREFLQAKDIYEQLAKIWPERYTPDLQMACNILELLSEQEE